MRKITIHTATYNRAYILGKAYESLASQTCKEFEWIITDDGSTDETAELVNRWQKKNNGFEIIYNRLSHVGIPRALNSGIAIASTDWFMMLDSDDYILPNTIENIQNWLDEIEDDEQFAGVGFLRCFPDGKYMKDQVPLIDARQGYVDATNIERKKYNLDMDMVEVTRIKYFRKYPFQYWPTEKYAPEQLNYNEIALKGYKYRWHNEKLYVCEYLPDGQTRDDRIVKNNPMGFAMMHNQNMLLTDSFLAKCRSAMQMTALSICGKAPSYILKTNCLSATLLTLPVGIALSFRRRRQFNNMK